MHEPIKVFCEYLCNEFKAYEYRLIDFMHKDFWCMTECVHYDF